MKSTGVTRKIDELGRIVIPKEIRKNLGIRDGESLEIYTEQESILLKKHSEIQKYEDLSNKLCEMISNIYNLNIIITDREKVIATSIKEDILNRKINNQIIELIDNRNFYVSKEIENINFEDINIKGHFTIAPIISSIDSLGTVIIIDNNNEIHDKLAQLLTNIIANNINI